MTDTEPREAIAQLLTEMAEMLTGEHAWIATRLLNVVGELRAAPSGDLPDYLVRKARRLREGTMGSLSDIIFGQFIDRRWVPDEARDRRFADLSRQLATQMARLPASHPPDYFLVTDRVRECWLVEPPSSNGSSWTVEVQPPVWMDAHATTEHVMLRSRGAGALDANGAVEVEIRALATDASAQGGLGTRPTVALGVGQLRTTREAAGAAH